MKSDKIIFPWESCIHCDYFKAIIEQNEENILIRCSNQDLCERLHRMALEDYKKEKNNG